MPNKHDLASDRSISEKIQADVNERQSGPETYFVEYGPEDVQLEPRTAQNAILLETDLITDPIDPVVVAEGFVEPEDDDASGTTVRFQGDLDTEQYSIFIEDALETDTVVLQDDSRILQALSVVADVARHSEESIEDEVKLDEFSSSRMYDIYRDVITSRVRMDVVSGWTEHLPAVDITDDGAVVDNHFVITWEAENYVLDDVNAVDPDGSPRSDADESHEFIGAEFETEPMIEATLDGESYDLSESEQQFIALCKVLSYPDRYLGTGSSLVNHVHNVKRDENDRMEQISNSVHVTHYMDPVSGIVHPHGIDKHTLRASFNVCSWVIDDLLYTEFDHAGVNELSWRETEFRNAAEPVFVDTDNQDDDRWGQINSTARSARVPDFVRRELRSQYGSRSSGS